METAGKERRRFERKKGCLPALVELPFRPPVACVVEDISVAGALILPSEPLWFPQVFKLIITASDFATYCEVRHRGVDRIGVAFVDIPYVGDIDGWPDADDQDDIVPVVS